MLRAAVPTAAAKLGRAGPGRGRARPSGPRHSRTLRALSCCACLWQLSFCVLLGWSAAALCTARASGSVHPGQVLAPLATPPTAPTLPRPDVTSIVRGIASGQQARSCPAGAMQAHAVIVATSATRACAGATRTYNSMCLLHARGYRNFWPWKPRAGSQQRPTLHVHKKPCAL